MIFKKKSLKFKKIMISKMNPRLIKNELNEINSNYDNIIIIIFIIQMWLNSNAFIFFYRKIFGIFINSKRARYIWINKKYS